MKLKTSQVSNVRSRLSMAELRSAAIRSKSFSRAPAQILTASSDQTLMCRWHECGVSATARVQRERSSLDIYRNESLQGSSPGLCKRPCLQLTDLALKLPFGHSTFYHCKGGAVKLLTSKSSPFRLSIFRHCCHIGLQQPVQSVITRGCC